MTKKDVDLEKLIITQANALIEAAYKMTLQEKRLMSLLISLVRQNDKSFKGYKIPISQALPLLGLENNKDFYQRLRSITRALLGRVLDVNLEGEEWVQFQWVSRARYISKAKSDIGEAYIELKIHEDLEPLLLALTKNFSSIPFKAIINIPSQYSLRVLEILHNRSQRTKKEGFYIALDELKRKLGIDSAYPNFKDFRRRVLEKAELDCKAYGHIYFTYELEKKGKKVIGLHFTVWPNSKFDNKNNNIAPKQVQIFELPQAKVQGEPKSQATNIFKHKTESTSKLTLLERLISGFDLTAKQARSFLEDYDENYIEGNLKVVEKHKKEGSIKNIGAYTFQALTNDYRKKELKKENGKVESPTATAQLKISSEHKILITELSKMGYLGNGLELIERIGKEGVQDVIELAKEQEKVSKGTGKEISNMGGLINWLVETEAWKAVSIQREVQKEAQLRIKQAQLKAERSNKVAELVESVTTEYSNAYRDYIGEYWRTVLSEEERVWVKEDIKLNANNFVIEQISMREWREDDMFFIVERDSALKRLKLEPELPEYLENKEVYLHSQSQYKHLEPEIIKEVIAAFG